MRGSRKGRRYHRVNEALQFGSAHSFIILGSCLGGKHDWANVALFEERNITESEWCDQTHSRASPAAFYLINLLWEDRKHTNSMHSQNTHTQPPPPKKKQPKNKWPPVSKHLVTLGRKTSFKQGETSSRTREAQSSDATSWGQEKVILEIVKTEQSTDSGRFKESQLS